MALTFRGGIHVPEEKNTRTKGVRSFDNPRTVSIPMLQHIGAPCTPTVKKGDKVDMGQVIGEVTQGLGCPVHASVSGTVIGIEQKSNSMGVAVTHVIIENDMLGRVCPDIKPYSGSFTDITFDEVVDVVRRAGISGMGGATFPTYAKIQSAKDKVDTLIVNCAECEPYITANHRLLLEEPEAVIGGMKILLRALGIRCGDIAIEDNKPDAIKLIREMTKGSGYAEVKVLKTKYPQGDERQLIYAITGKEIPAGKLPADVGCVVFNAETCASVYRAFVYGMPLIKRIVTVDGDCIADPCSVKCPIGTPYRELIDFCGGTTEEYEYIVNGGPMMGQGQWDVDAPVTKGTSAVLVFASKDKAYEQPSTCIRCGRCVRACQMRLMPNYIALFSREGKYELCEQYDVMSCVECGACTYVCPGAVPITQLNRAAKAKINEKRRLMKGGVK
ncbi:MAG: electron transport complex subunit RsxC [Clostridia bacterium]|nr:electron transport complex subunit RsxC [Clostridia bacterium]